MPSVVANAARNILRWYSVLVALLAWHILSISGVVPQRLMPDLGTIWEAFWRALQNGDLLYHSGFSLGRAMMGYGAAIVVGVVLGVLMARSRGFESLFEPIFSFGYPVPKIALYPIFIFIFGLGTLSKVVLIFLECLYPITVNTYYGMKSVDKVYLWSAWNMGASQQQTFWKILIPAAAPYIFSGLRIALPIALILVITTEMIGESTGLGYYITFAQSSFDYPQIFAGMLAIGIWGFVLDRLLIWLRNRIIFWEKGPTAIG